MQTLERPAVADELRRQPVEQFRMRGRCALRAEVIFRLDDAQPEMPLPDAIDRHSRRERIGAVHQPAGKIEPRGKARIERGGNLNDRQPTGRVGHNDRALAGEIAAQVNVRLARLGPLLEHQRGRDVRLVLFQFRQSRFQPVSRLQQAHAARPANGSGCISPPTACRALSRVRT